MLHIALGEYEPAVGSFKAVLELLPERKVPPLLGSREEARTSAQRGLVLACCRWLTRSDASQKETTAAIAYVKKLLDEVQVYSSGPVARWDVGEFESVLLNALGVAQSRLGLYEDAQNTFGAALRETRRIPSETRAGFRQSIMLNRAFIEAEQAWAAEGISDSSKRSRLRDAAKKLAEAASGESSPALLRSIAYSLSAQCYAGAGKEKDAEEELRKAADLAPDSTTVLVNLAVACDLQGKKAEAIKYYEEALKLGELKRRIEIEGRLAKLRE
jgi:tetratricopeptide (TPR) repeat protein